MANSYKVGVKTGNDVNWASNSLRFKTKEEAESYGLDLAMRWTAVRDWEVQESEDEPNRG